MTELEAWLRLWHIPKVGPKTFNFLLSKYPDLYELFNCTATQLIENEVPNHIAQAIIANRSEQYLTDIQWLKSSDSRHIILINDPAYPELLRNINSPPPLIYSIGNIELLSAPLLLSIVGSRSASTLGGKIAQQIAYELAQLGIVIVSGLAHGIDGHAHEGALNIKSGSTIAVLANGLDIVYPSTHSHLAQRIISNGLLISEFPPGVKPLPQHFPRRNRIISGLSLGTLVIEAAHKSGSLITAKYALEQGREVFAVPGLINNTHNQGCHELIQQGAKLTTCVDDILTELLPMTGLNLLHSSQNCSNNHQVLSADLENLLNHIEYTPIPMEKIIEKSGLTPERVSSMLTELELGGRVATDAFGLYYRL